jgi:hypothetical protein
VGLDRSRGTPSVSNQWDKKLMLDRTAVRAGSVDVNVIRKRRYRPAGLAIVPSDPTWAQLLNVVPSTLVIVSTLIPVPAGRLATQDAKSQVTELPPPGEKTARNETVEDVGRGNVPSTDILTVWPMPTATTGRQAGFTKTATRHGL